MSGSDGIGPTAHYTGYVWVRNGLSHPELSTAQGRLLYESLRPAMTVSRALGGSTLEAYLLARHRAIDALLDEAIERHGVTQVVEIACGLSPRGWRMHERYGDRLTYIETDLPEMAERKRAALARIGSLDRRHRVAAVDALRYGGDGSLAALAGQLDAGQGLAMVTEGLLGYLPTAELRGFWRRSARVLRGFPAGRYVSDLHLDSVQTLQVRAFRLVLSAFVRSQVHLHFEGAAQACQALREAGFATAAIRRAVDIAPDGPRDRETGWAPAGAGRPAAGGGSDLAHILEASTNDLRHSLQ